MGIKLQPFNEMPIWARLAFMAMIPKTYFYDYDSPRPVKPRAATDATIIGFERTGDIIWIHYTMVWPDAPHIQDGYIWPAEKVWSGDRKYDLTPLEDPTTFGELRDNRSYHQCYLPAHTHYVPFPFATCYAEGSWTWEEKYAR